MRIFLAGINSGMNKQIRQKIYKKYKAKYALETFFNGENKYKKALYFIGNEN